MLTEKQFLLDFSEAGSYSYTIIYGKRFVKEREDSKAISMTE